MIVKPFFLMVLVVTVHMILINQGLAKEVSWTYTCNNFNGTTISLIYDNILIVIFISVGLINLLVFEFGRSAFVEI